MKTVSEISKLFGISVRTLHYYDSIGLLKPTKLTESGYRLYDEQAIVRLQNILIFREIEIPLKEIKEILEKEQLNFEEIMTAQIKLLQMKKEKIEKLIAFALDIKEKGEMEMNTEIFNVEEMEQYKNEVIKKWGSTSEYKEYEQKMKGKTEKEKQETMQKLMYFFQELGEWKESLPEDSKVQNKIQELQQFITDHFYTCTNEILYGLGQMYVQDERMKHNIDKAGGEGTAQFVQKAITIYCKK